MPGTNVGLFHQSLTFLVYAKQIRFPQWPTAKNEFHIRITRRIRNRIRKYLVLVRYIKHGPKWGRLKKKAKGCKPHSSVSLNNYMLEDRNNIFPAGGDNIEPYFPELSFSEGMTAAL
jgi:hypothetical protein